MTTEKSNSHKLFYAVLITLCVVVAYLVTGHADKTLKYLLQDNTEVIDSLMHNMQKRQQYRDSLVDAKLETIERLSRLKQAQNTLIYEYQKDSVRVAGLPYDSLHFQLARDINTIYR